MMIVWRLRGKIIRTVLCCTTIVPDHMHADMSSSCSLTSPVGLGLVSFYVYFCIFLTRASMVILYFCVIFIIWFLFGCHCQYQHSWLPGKTHLVRGHRIRSDSNLTNIVVSTVSSPQICHICFINIEFSVANQFKFRILALLSKQLLIGILFRKNSSTLLSQEELLLAQNMLKSACRPGSARIRWGAYSAPVDP